MPCPMPRKLAVVVGTETIYLEDAAQGPEHGKVLSCHSTAGVFKANWGQKAQCCVQGMGWGFLFPCCLYTWSFICRF